MDPELILIVVIGRAQIMKSRSSEVCARADVGSLYSNKVHRVCVEREAFQHQILRACKFRAVFTTWASVLQSIDWTPHYR